MNEGPSVAMSVGMGASPTDSDENGIEW